MKISKTIKLSILVFTISIIIASGQNNPPKTETTETLLNRQVTSRTLSNADSISLFQSVITQTSLSGGIVLTNCLTSTDRDFAIPNKTSFGNLLKSMGIADPDYRWELTDGVLNLLPKTTIPKLLDLPIKEFRAENVTADEALNMLRQKTEVKEKIVEAGFDKAINSLHIISVYIPESERKNIPRFNLNLQEATFREILNQIVKNHGRLTWVYIEKNCDERKLFSIYFVE